MHRERLAAAGRLLFGEQWQTGIARALGPLHPGGAREAIDDRLVRRWAAGERDVPEWVEPAVAGLMTRRAEEITAWLRRSRT